LIRTAAAGGKDPDPNGFERTEASADEIVNAKKEKEARDPAGAGFHQLGIGHSVSYGNDPRRIPIKEANIC